MTNGLTQHTIVEELTSIQLVEAQGHYANCCDLSAQIVQTMIRQFLYELFNGVFSAY